MSISSRKAFFRVIREYRLKGWNDTANMLVNDYFKTLWGV